MHPMLYLSQNSSNQLDLHLNTPQLVTLAIFNTLATVLGLTGNTLILYSSLRYNAIQLDQISLLFIQNLAVADIFYIFCNIFPSTITLILRKYVLGDVYCFVSAHLSFLPGCVNTLTILTLTAYKLRMVCAPLRCVISTRTAKIVIFAIWAFATLPSDISLGFKSKSIFVQSSAKCFSSIYNSDVISSTAFSFAISSLIFLPILGITILNTILCVIAYRSSRRDAVNVGRPGSKALTTVCMLSGLFIISWTPYIIYVMWKYSDRNVPHALELFGVQAIELNSFGNPILYTFTNKRFGRYVFRVARGLIMGKTKIPSQLTSSSQGNEIKRPGKYKTQHTSECLSIPNKNVASSSNMQNP